MIIDFETPRRRAWIRTIAHSAGDCDTCGRWDSNLKQGMCQACVRQFRPISLKDLLPTLQRKVTT